MFAGGPERLPDCPLLSPPTWDDIYLSGSCASETKGATSESEGEHGSWGFGTVLCLIASLAFCALGVSVVIKGREGDTTGNAVPTVYQQYSAAAQPTQSMEEYAANIRAAKAQSQPAGADPSTQSLDYPVAAGNVGTGLQGAKDDAEADMVADL